MVDWKKLFDDWNKLPDDYKRKIESAFREKSVEKLSELFRKEPDALTLYESVIGPWRWGRDELPPITYVHPYPGQLSEEEMIKWAADQALNSVQDGYIWRSARQIFKKAGRDEAAKSLREHLRNAGAGGPQQPSWDGMPNGIKITSPDRKDEYRVTWAALIDYVLTKDPTPGYSYLGLHEKVEIPEKVRAPWQAYPSIPEEGITEEWLEAVKKLVPYVNPSIDVNKDFTYSVNLNKRIEELNDVVPMLIVPLKTPPEVESFLASNQFEGWKWKPEDVTRPPEYVEAKGIWDTTYRREDLEPLNKDEVDKIAKVKGLSAAGKKEEVIDRILGVTPPPVEKAAPTPAARPPARVAIAPQLVGLRKGDDEAFSDIFLTRLMEGTLSPGAARGHLPEFRTLLVDLKVQVKDVPRDRALALVRSDVEALADKIVARKPPTARLPAVPLLPPEEVPPVVFPTVAPLPPPGIMRLYGMPWGYEKCTVCLGEVAQGERSPEDVHVVLRSRYLEMRLRRIGVPTTDSGFYELCQEEHKRRRGASYEYYPRDRIEFWVGEVIGRHEMDIAELVNIGISEQYCLYAEKFYFENKHLIPLRPGEDP